jgi:hypothetical protein
MINETLCIVRSIGEATEVNCQNLLVDNGFPIEQTIILNEKPFAKSIHVSFLKAIELKYKYLLIIDADVLLRKDNIHELFNHVDDNVFVVQGMIIDYITNEVRSAGNHLYNVKHLPFALNFLDINTSLVRPECDLILKMSQLGYKYIVTSSLIGIHDYYQDPNDIYRKSYLHAIKHSSKIIKILEIIKIRDDSYTNPVINGIISGLFNTENVSVNYNEKYKLLDVFKNLTYSQIEPSNLTFDNIEDCILKFNSQSNYFDKYNHIFNLKYQNIYITLLEKAKFFLKINIKIVVLLLLFRINYRISNYLKKH